MSRREIKGRYHLLDEIRGFAVICMVFFHGFYTCYEIFSSGIFGDLINFFLPAEPFFAGGFVFISGMCGLFSKNPWKRTVILISVSGALSAVTYFISENLKISCFIIFGIIHLLAACWLALSALKPVLLKCPPLVGFVLNALLVPFFYNVEHGFLGFGGFKITLPQSLYSGNFLWIFGFPSKDFASADYFPLLPWLFVFFAGFFFCRMFKKGLPDLFKKNPLPPLAFVGRHALIFYVGHQPVIFLICQLIYRFL